MLFFASTYVVWVAIEIGNTKTIVDVLGGLNEHSYELLLSLSLSHIEEQT